LLQAKAPFRDIRTSGLTAIDEASRAVLNLCWIAGGLLGVASREAELVGSILFVEDPDSSEPGPVRFIRESDLGRREHLDEVREWWPRWCQGVERVFKALSEVEWERLQMDPDRIYQVVTEWQSWFAGPILEHRAERPGDHLFRPGGALRAHRGTGANLDLKRFADMIREMELYGQRLRLLDLHAPARPDDLRSSSWFRKATKEGLNSATLRQAQRDGRLPGSVSDGKRWFFPISGVVKICPEYKRQIEAAIAETNP